MSDPVIPEAAVEAAAIAYCADLTQLGHPAWGDLTETGRQIRLEVMSAALEAAAPHMLAGALGAGDEAWDRNRVAIGANPFKSEA